jgi:hemerythrin-like domain-containing protein
MTPEMQDTAPTDVHDMVVVHRVFRRELVLIPQLVHAVAPGDTTRAAVIAKHARLILSGLHLHHTGEDELLWPRLLERAAPSSELVQRMEAQHHVVEDLIATLTPALARWEAEARPAVSEEVGATFDQLRVALLEHLDEEEASILPLAAEHLTQDEWNKLGEHAMKRMSKSQLPLMGWAILEEATPDEQSAMLATMPAPVRVLMRTVFASRYRRYIRKVRSAA